MDYGNLPSTYVNKLPSRPSIVIATQRRKEGSVKARLLLVEDSATQGSQTKSELEHLGYDVRWVKSGIEALKWARQDPPDLIVLDVVMDDIDGFAVCRWLKLHNGTRDI